MSCSVSDLHSFRLSGFLGLITLDGPVGLRRQRTSPGDRAMGRDTGPGPTTRRRTVAEVVGKRMVVTGASSGIGRCFAQRLAEWAESLLLVARDEARLEQLASELSAIGRLEARVLVADLSTEAGCERVSRELEARPPDLLVNNAGYGTRGAFAELAIDGELRQVATNLIAPMRLTHACLPGMLARNSGSVIQVSSLASELYSPLAATYGATKAFLTHFTESLSEELRDSEVRIQALLPGFTRTEFQSRAGVDTSKVPSFAWMSSEAVVEASLESLSRGDTVCIPGLRYRALYGISRLLPRSILRRLLGAKRFR
jgi:short-subunit dehydrogenase